MGSFQQIDHPTGGAPIGASESAWSGAVNLFSSPVKNVDLGGEFRHAKRILVDGPSGRLDRGALAARYSF